MLPRNRSSVRVATALTLVATAMEIMLATRQRIAPETISYAYFRPSSFRSDFARSSGVMQG
jgi:hypothetical protein